MSYRSPLLLVFLLVAGVLAAPPPGGAQQADAEAQARALLEEGRAYRDQGKVKQAIDNFEIVINSFPGTGSVGQALLEIGRYRMEVEQDDKGAREAFEQVSREHAQSSAAPGAYYYLGLLLLDRATTPSALDDALAQFSRVETLYPGTEWVPRALQASALVHRRAGRFGDAVALNRRVSLEYPASDAAPRAQFEVGHGLALLDEPRRAMEEFQNVRNRFPESPWARSALERITALYRLHGAAQPTFALDSGFSLSGGNALKDVEAILVAPDQMLWVASRKTNSAVSFSPAGKMGESRPARDPRTLSLTLDGQVVFAAKTAVRIGPRDIRSLYFPPEKPGEERKPVDRILAAAVSPGGAVLVSDEKNDAVFRFNAGGELEGRFPRGDTKKREVIRIILDEERGILLLDKEDKTIRVCNESGRTIRTVGPGGLRKPVDVAVDAFRNVYVADEDQGVLVFNPRGELFFKIGGSELKKATAVTLQADGAVLVYDDGADRILRYR